MGQEMQSCGRIFNLNLQGPGNKNQQTVRQEPLSYNDISFYDYLSFVMIILSICRQTSAIWFLGFINKQTNFNVSHIQYFYLQYKQHNL